MYFPNFWARPEMSALYAVKAPFIKSKNQQTTVICIKFNKDRLQGQLADTQILQYFLQVRTQKWGLICFKAVARLMKAAGDVTLQCTGGGTELIQHDCYWCYFRANIKITYKVCGFFFFYWKKGVCLWSTNYYTSMFFNLPFSSIKYIYFCMSDFFLPLVYRLFKN